MPLLVSSLMMVLLGITAAACSPPLKWFAFSVACCFGGMVFASVAQCFRALYLIVPAYAYAKGAARCLVGAMGFAFVGGWLLFPLMFALGHLGAGLISRDLEAVGQFFGATKTLQPRAPQAATVCYPGCAPTVSRLRPDSASRLWLYACRRLPGEELIRRARLRRQGTIPSLLAAPRGRCRDHLLCQPGPLP